MMKYFAFAAYAATIPAANWMIGHVGSCIPNGPCLLTLGFGLAAPSGVLMIGAALVLRDAVQSAFGMRITLFAIAIGAVLSGLVAPPALLMASIVSFALSELADLAVYSPLRARSMPIAVLASGAVGSVVDSVLFLLIAFGSLDFIAGQIIGKLAISALVAGILALSSTAKESQHE